MEAELILLTPKKGHQDLGGRRPPSLFRERARPPYEDEGLATLRRPRELVTSSRCRLPPPCSGAIQLALLPLSTDPLPEAEVGERKVCSDARWSRVSRRTKIWHNTVLREGTCVYSPSQCETYFERNKFPPTHTSAAPCGPSRGLTIHRRDNSRLGRSAPLAERGGASRTTLPDYVKGIEESLLPSRSGVSVLYAGFLSTLLGIIYRLLLFQQLFLPSCPLIYRFMLR